LKQEEWVIEWIDYFESHGESSALAEEDIAIVLS